MRNPSTTHATFVIERVYEATPARVFAAWSKAEAKARWFACHDDWRPLEYALDFRVGGRETNRVQPPGGLVHAYDARYYDIIPERRIVFAYEMHVGDARISVSLATVELETQGAGTRLTFTEQGAFLDGLSNAADREEGTRVGLENLAAELGR
jgi:uncharacterized protein YndB with AHSA1/START domain